MNPDQIADRHQRQQEDYARAYLNPPKVGVVEECPNTKPMKENLTRLSELKNGEKFRFQGKDEIFRGFGLRRGVSVYMRWFYVYTDDRDKEHYLNINEARKTTVEVIP